MPDRYSIFGANGLVGSAVAAELEAEGRAVRRITRGAWPETGEALGHVIFTIGMTADFRSRLIETFDLQILRLHEAFDRYSFDSFTYLSSARVYAGAKSTSEGAELLVRPTSVDHAYNITKLAGESRCFVEDNPQVRVVRLSNVYGTQDASNLFLTAVMRDAVANGAVTIGQSPLSSKDYIAVEDAAKAIVRIAQRGRHRLYNVACGRNVTHREIADILVSENYSVDFREGGALADFPVIDAGRLDAEFGLAREGLQTGMVRVLRALEQKRKNHDRI
jgi:nucleoside-diphosphate-sugar epimerase